MSAGTALKTYGSPATFSANKNNVAQTIPAATGTVITFSTKDWDTINCFASNKYTPNLAGKYLFQGSLFFSATGGDLQLFVRKNGATYFMLCNSTTAAQVAGSVVVSMNGSTDYVEAMIFQNNGGDINGDPTYTRFQGTWLSP